MRKLNIEQIVQASISWKINADGSRYGGHGFENFQTQ